MWEFLRRNPRYQELCDLYWSVDCELPKEVSTEFGLRPISSFPHYSSESATSEKLIGQGDGIEYILLDPLEFEHFRPMLWHPSKEMLPNINLLDLLERRVTDHSVFTKFDLSYSIDKQLDVIKNELIKMQKDRGLKTKSGSHIKKFPTYLRILDAVSKRVKSRLIRDSLFHYISDGYPDNPRKDRFKDTLAAATKLRDVDYRFIMLDAYKHPDIDEKKHRT